ncbi:NGG1p interacting factor 3 [Meira miltonrushii]|uniref:NGG1p interacting factor 3 n=1 Tax=Meira miltonrushii TaxID=1280837 RepID=A0A316VKP5_9BASI|nr:NGG1p interacting factor 3 [Meira miltonrushii]PWN38126.1 NGG1p interacting factor 3 [Meira miltonrushii]
MPQEAVPAYIQHDGKLSALYQAMNQIAPLSMADTSWDNVGVQIQAPEPEKNKGNVIMLCEDLRTAVVDEALERGDVAIIMTYHPIIFRGLKSLTFNDTQQKSLLRLTAANISVYAAHTSLDASTNGLNDWLARVVSNQQSDVVKSDTPSNSLPPAIEPLTKSYESHPNAGQGRIVELKEAISVDQLVSNIKSNLQLKNVILGLPHNFDPKEARLTNIAVGAGSAGSIVTKYPKAQAYVTGELSHHEALAAVEKGIVVITTLHGNSERGYLRQVLVNKLEKTLASINSGTPLKVVASQTDSEPLEIV